MELFDIKTGKIVLSPTSLAVPAFKKIWEGTKDKTEAEKEISYIVFKHHFKSPYKDFSDDDKEKSIKKELFGDPNWEPRDDVKKAEEEYLKHQQTTNSELLKSAKKATEELAKYFEKINFDELDKFGKPKYSAKDLSSNLGNVGNIVKSLSNLERQVMAEQLENSKIRGQSELGLYELP